MVAVSLAPIPARMLHDSVTLKVVTSMDAYQAKIYTDYAIDHVHLQGSSDTIKGPNDTEVQLRAVLFVDARRSTPCYDLDALQAQSLAAGGTMRAVVKNADGNTVGDFAVLIVDSLPDVPATHVRHWELSLI